MIFQTIFNLVASNGSVLGDKTVDCNFWMIAEQIVLIFGLFLGIFGVYYLIKIKRLTVRNLNKLFGYFAWGVTCLVSAMFMLFFMNAFGFRYYEVLGFIGVSLVTMGFVLILLGGKELLQIINQFARVGISKERSMIPKI
jgi:hypothetical protein